MAPKKAKSSGSIVTKHDESGQVYTESISNAPSHDSTWKFKTLGSRAQYESYNSSFGCPSLLKMAERACQLYSRHLTQENLKALPERLGLRLWILLREANLDSIAVHAAFACTYPDEIPYGQFQIRHPTLPPLTYVQELTFPNMVTYVTLANVRIMRASIYQLGQCSSMTALVLGPDLEFTDSGYGPDNAFIRNLALMGRENAFINVHVLSIRGTSGVTPQIFKYMCNFSSLIVVSIQYQWRTSHDLGDFIRSPQIPSQGWLFDASEERRSMYADVSDAGIECYLPLDQALVEMCQTAKNICQRVGISSPRLGCKGKYKLPPAFDIKIGGPGYDSDEEPDDWPDESVDEVWVLVSRPLSHHSLRREQRRMKREYGSDVEIDIDTEDCIDTDTDTGDKDEDESPSKTPKRKSSKSKSKEKVESKSERKSKTESKTESKRKSKKRRVKASKGVTMGETLAEMGN